MSLPATKVEFGFNLQTLGSPGFILDNATLGVLGTSELGGINFFDVSQFVKSVTVKRGRSRQLDYFQAGTASIILNNIGREFDPLNESSPYYPGVVPRCLVRVTTADKPVFYGYVNDWDVDYSLVNADVVTASCSDAFMVLSNQSLNAFTPSSQTSGNRINSVLDRSEVAYVGGREIETGLSTLGAVAVSAGTNVLNYLRQVESSEPGFLFVSNAGDIVFRDRETESADLGSVVSFADDGSGVPYSSLTNQFGDELLYNIVEASSPAGSTTVTDSVSVLKYQVSKLSKTGLLNSSTNTVALVANSNLAKFREPQMRFTGLSVELSGLADDHVETVLLIDLLNYVNILKTFASGSPLSKTEFSYISSISHNIVPGRHTISFGVESAIATFFLIFADPVAGKLDFAMLDA
jgi:hypothetical protein